MFLKTFKVNDILFKSQNTITLKNRFEFVGNTKVNCLARLVSEEECVQDSLLKKK